MSPYTSTASMLLGLSKLAPRLEIEPFFDRDGFLDKL